MMAQTPTLNIATRSWHRGAYQQLRIDAFGAPATAGSPTYPDRAHDCCPGTLRGNGMEATPTNGVGGIPQGSTGDWAKVLGRLREEVGESAYRSWFRSMTVERIAGGEGVIGLPTHFLCNWVATHYADRLLSLWRTENQTVTRISFIVEPRIAGQGGNQSPPPTEPPPGNPEPGAPHEIGAEKGP